MTDQFLDQVRDLLEIGVGPVGFEHGELGIVFSRDAFVAEVAIQFEDLVEAADEQTLEIKFRRDAQIKIEPERLVMRAERLGRRAARDRLQHRRFHFEKTALLHETPDLAHDRDSFLENVARLLVRQQIEITLPVTRFDVLQAVPFFRQRPQRFSEHFERVDLQRRLAGLGEKTFALDADEIAEVEQVENLHRLRRRLPSRGCKPGCARSRRADRQNDFCPCRDAR